MKNKRRFTQQSNPQDVLDALLGIEPTPVPPVPLPIIQPEPAPAPFQAVPAEPNTHPPTVDELLRARGVTRTDVANTLRGLAMQHRDVQVDYVQWGNPLLCHFLGPRGTRFMVGCTIESFPSDDMKVRLANFTNFARSSG